MRFWPTIHTKRYSNVDSFDRDHLLSQDQEIAVDGQADEGANVPLLAREMSLHNALLFRGSKLKRRTNKRIGIDLRHAPTRLAQPKTSDFATLVPEKEIHRHFIHEPTPVADLARAAIAAHEASTEALCQGTQKAEFRP